MCSPWACFGLCEHDSVFTEKSLILSNKKILKTSQLPEDDRHSVSLKEYLAEIDVAMGGRVAEELSTLT